MGRRSFPKLAQSARFYVENTIRTRVRSPGIERYRPKRARLRTRRWLVALAVVAAVAILALLVLV